MMKNIKGLELELIELEDQILLVKEEDARTVHNHATLRMFHTCKDKIIASTKPLEGLPVLVIEDEVQKMADERFPEDGVHDNRMWQAVGFVKGYNKAKETFKFTEEDLKKALELGLILIDGNIHNEKHFNNLIQSLTKKELWVEVDVMNKGYTDESDKPYQECCIPKIIEDKIKAVWK